METMITLIYALITMFLLWGLLLSIGATPAVMRTALLAIPLITIPTILVIANGTVEPRDIARSQTVVTPQADARLPSAIDHETLPQDREDSADRRLRIEAGQPL